MVTILALLPWAIVPVTELRASDEEASLKRREGALGSRVVRISVARGQLLCWLCAVAVFGLVSGVASGADIAVSESQLKAAWLLNFAKLAEWPTDAFSSTNQPLVVGVMDDEAFEEQLERSLKGRTVHGRSLSVRRIERAGHEGECHVLFLGAVDSNQRGATLRKLKNSPVLTIDDSDGPAESGCVLRFLRVDNKIRFNVDLDAANAARMNLNPKLLQVANSVTGKRHETIQGSR